MGLQTTKTLSLQYQYILLTQMSPFLEFKRNSIKSCQYPCEDEGLKE